MIDDLTGKMGRFLADLRRAGALIRTAAGRVILDRESGLDDEHLEELEQLAEMSRPRSTPPGEWIGGRPVHGQIIMGHGPAAAKDDDVVVPKSRTSTEREAERLRRRIEKLQDQVRKMDWKTKKKARQNEPK